MNFLKNIFDSSPSGPYRSPAQFKENKEKQVTMSPRTMEQLRKYGITAETELKLEYFFYTNTEEKASKLAKALAEIGYDGGYNVSASNKKEYVITGWTSKLPMIDQRVIDWTAKMCDLGADHDCEFDGWGTNPKQQ